MTDPGSGCVHPTDRMTSRERLLAAYRRQEVDRLPYWAKVANSTWQSSQPAPVRDWSARELLDYIHADGIFHVGRGVQAEPTRITWQDRREGNVRTRTTHTPDGPLVERWTMDPCTQSWHPTEFPVKTPQDLRRCRWLYADQRVSVCREDLAAARGQVERIGQRGITAAAWGTSPLMHLVEHVIGPAETVYFLADYPDEMDELIALMHEADKALVAATAEHTPADVVVSVENTSTTLISPALFQKYCLPHLCDYGRIVGSAGKLHELHMCGHLRDLLGRIETIPAASIEAFTAPPLGNTRLADGKALAPSKALIGGTCVNVWWRQGPQQIQQYILGELDACPDHRGIVVTTAGVAPPACPAETFRALGQWLPTVPVRA